MSSTEWGKIPVPRKYRKAMHLIIRYREGFADGLKSGDMAGEEFVRRHQGESAWRAYSDGYEAGKAARVDAKQQVPMKPWWRRVFR